MGFNINNNYGPNIDVHDGGVVNLRQDGSGLWHTDDVVEAEAECIMQNAECIMTEELFHFVHPEVDDEGAWRIHNAVKRLVARQGIQEICSFLLQMKKDGKVLLPQSPSVAYTELVRIGMPNGEGYSLKTFERYYKR